MTVPLVSRLRSVVLLAGTIALLTAATGHAQLALPGAVAPAPEGAVQSPETPARPKHHSPTASLGSEDDGPRKLPPAIVPSPAGLAGKTLSLNGDKSQVTFAAQDKGLAVSKLTLAGESMDDSRQACTVEAPGVPLTVKPVGRPDGVERVQLDFAPCPLAFDVLEGAALVDRTQGVCEFAAAKCRINPVGLWGPQSGDLGPDRVKAIERTRSEAERSVRSNYQALVHSTKDRNAIMGYARDQAQFSSTREEICHDYVGEGRHGFCSDKLTEARAAFLRAELGNAIEKKAEKKQERNKERAARSR